MAPLEETPHMADVAKLDKDGVFEEAFYTDPERLMKVVSCLAVIGGHLRIQTEDIGLIQYQSFAGGQEVSYMDAVDGGGFQNGHNGCQVRVLFQAAQDDDRQLLSSRLFVGEGG